jgi:hypothetical protein
VADGALRQVDALSPLHCVALGQPRRHDHGRHQRIVARGLGDAGPGGVIVPGAGERCGRWILAGPVALRRKAGPEAIVHLEERDGAAVGEHLAQLVIVALVGIGKGDALAGDEIDRAPRRIDDGFLVEEVPIVRAAVAAAILQKRDPRRRRRRIDLHHAIFDVDAVHTAVALEEVGEHGVEPAVLPDGVAEREAKAGQRVALPVRSRRPVKDDAAPGAIPSGAAVGLDLMLGDFVVDGPIDEVEPPGIARCDRQRAVAELGVPVVRRAHTAAALAPRGRRPRPGPQVRAVGATMAAEPQADERGEHGAARHMPGAA